MKIFFFLIGTLILAFMAENAWADDKHHAPRETKVNVSSQAISIAASQLSFDWNTNRFQAGIGTGTHKNVNAISFGAGKRINKKVLINGSISMDGSDSAYGMGFNFRF